MEHRQHAQTVDRGLTAQPQTTPVNYVQKVLDSYNFQYLFLWQNSKLATILFCIINDYKQVEG